VVDLVSPAGKVSTVSADSAFVASAGSYFVVGDAAVEKISHTGQVTARSNKIAQMVPRRAAVVPDARVVIASKNGLATLDVSSGTLSQIALPNFPCNPSGAALPPGASPPSSPPATSCAARALGVAVDSAGNIWFVDNGGRIGEVAAGRY